MWVPIPFYCLMCSMCSVSQKGYRPGAVFSEGGVTFPYVTEAHKPGSLTPEGAEMGSVG